jgi:hypothetical protein
MKRLVLACTFALAGALISAQTHFYVDVITVQPNAPTAQDPVSISLHGGLSSTGAYISAASAEVNGNTVTINIVALDPGGATVIVPHTETVNVGVLPAGAYEIVINGTSVADLAQTPDHFFTVTAGDDPCVDVDIDFVQWAPFSDTALIVHVYNLSTELFDYPGFVLLDANGDTLAMETVNFFGIGLDSYHTLRIHPDATIPVGSSMLSLHLWTGFYSEQACTWDLLLDLCPPAPCQTLYPIMQNYGGGFTLGDFGWTVQNVDFETVASGTFTLTAMEQADTDTLCLPPGHYFMECTPQQGSTGGQPYFGVMTSIWIDGPQTPVVWSLPVPLAFDFLPGCLESTNDVNEASLVSNVVVGSTVNGIVLSSPDGMPLGQIEIMDVRGRVLHRSSTTSNTELIDLHGIGSCVLIVRVDGTALRTVRGAR